MMGIELFKIELWRKIKMFEITILNVIIGDFNRALFAFFTCDNITQIELFFIRIKG